ncbi:hypothetical protein ACFVZH_37165 [Streptomyces sp. NPDC059534]|uniref:hypothetical protein n=1 Tax=Streptomyces sp. NPDC059534 TaxID=3346859 RepID=UPI0036A933FD
MSTTTLLVLLLLTVTGLFVVAAPAYLVWRHPRLRAPSRSPWPPAPCSSLPSSASPS